MCEYTRFLIMHNAQVYLESFKNCIVLYTVYNTLSAAALVAQSVLLNRHMQSLHCELQSNL